MQNSMPLGLKYFFSFFLSSRLHPSGGRRQGSTVPITDLKNDQDYHCELPGECSFRRVPANTLIRIDSRQDFSRTTAVWNVKVRRRYHLVGDISQYAKAFVEYAFDLSTRFAVCYLIQTAVCIPICVTRRIAAGILFSS